MRIQRPKLKHVKGLNAVLDKLERAEDSMVQRAMELVLYLLCAVQYDFINRIVTGQVEEMFQLTPNSICYLLDLKWEEAHHAKLFVLTGGYVKNIKILNYAKDVDKAKNKKQIFTIGVTQDYKDVAIELEEGFMTTVEGRTYEVPSRPLWEKYKKYLKWVVKMGDYSAMLEDSTWLTKFEEMQKDFSEIVRDDVKSRGKKIRFESIVQGAQTNINGMIGTEIGKDFLTPNDLVDIAEKQKGNFTQRAWNRIRKKFKSAIIDGRMPTSVADKLNIKIPKKYRK